jgi:exonuclease V gamma subunit
MSIQLYFSNRLDKLAEQFALMVDLENKRKENIFKAPLVIAPNGNLIKWLQLMLARAVCLHEYGLSVFRDRPVGFADKPRH